MTRLHAAILFAVGLLGLSACSSETVKLVQPRTGATIECGGSGSGLMYGAAAGIVDECVKRYERDGYVPAERLTPGERADLERRGLLKPSAEPRPTMY